MRCKSFYILIALFVAQPVLISAAQTATPQETKPTGAISEETAIPSVAPAQTSKTSTAQITAALGILSTLSIILGYIAYQALPKQCQRQIEEFQPRYPTHPMWAPAVEHIKAHKKAAQILKPPLTSTAKAILTSKKKPKPSALYPLLPTEEPSEVQPSAPPPLPGEEEFRPSSLPIYPIKVPTESGQVSYAPMQQQSTDMSTARIKLQIPEWAILPHTPQITE